MCETKKCRKCGVEKPRSDFFADSTKTTGLQGRCKECKKDPSPCTAIPWEDRFWAKVSKPADGNGCWEWTAVLNEAGYGVFGVPGGIDRAHRISWRLKFGAIDAGMFICHKCDNRKCVNPDHLFQGSPRDNVLDMRSKGRMVAPPTMRGESNCRNRFSVEDVVQMRSEYRAGASIREICGRVGAWYNTVKRIVLHESWAHIE